MPRMSDNESPSLRFAEQASAPSQTASGDYPGIPSGDQRLYLSQTDHWAYLVDSTGAAHRIAFETDGVIQAGSPGTVDHYLRITLDRGSHWYRIPLVAE